ncbi:CoA transferase [Lysinibacter sp. HNR]|uniref:CoA transferase n=1 Tax=Lysinibacter sp. HNR TaxID=3031408 RepID=UPI00243558A6|nr:CoA transferase [Lysinibacter sp. HNR]WGD36434.1 CoA transferase [Lysinibacter sp. HNR]
MFTALTTNFEPDKLLSPLTAVPRRGPRRWWGGPLDVEGLALASVSTAAATINRLMGQPVITNVDAGRVASSFNSLELLRIAGTRPQGFAELSGFFETADGWIRTHANYPHHAQRLCSALNATTKNSIAAKLLQMPSAEAEEHITSRDGVAAAVRTRAAWQSSPMASLATAPTWIQLVPSATPHSQQEKVWTPNETAALPLIGLRVLDLTRTIAGPIASRSLAALGADVLRVDPPDLPELLEQHIDTGGGKRTATANLEDPRALAKFHGLLQSAHILLVGYRPGSLDRFDLSVTDLQTRYPRLIIVTLNAWGNNSSWGQKRGFDSIVQSAVGIADVYRTPDGKPGSLPVQALDHATGYGILAAAATLLTIQTHHGHAGHAQLSLAHTADLLWETPVPHDPIQELAEPPYATRMSNYGELKYVFPPFDLGEKPVDYPSPPHRYGSDTLTWLPKEPSL